jgi:hypothetical protein
MPVTKRTRGQVEGTFEVCAHWVRYRYWDNLPHNPSPELLERLEESAEERAKECIIDGYVEGELNHCDGEREIRGWWEIDRS